MNSNVAESLRGRGVIPSAHRVAIGEYVLRTTEHPSADQVWERVKTSFPMLSRATVYNTLNLFVRKRLLRELILAEGKVVFDPNVAEHHHLVDEESGIIYDIPWDAVQVTGLDSIVDLEIDSYQVVARGRRRRQ